MPAPNNAPNAPVNNAGVGDPGQQQQQQPGMMPNGGGNMMGAPQGMGYGYNMYGMDPAAAAAMYGGYPNMMGMVSAGLRARTLSSLVQPLFLSLFSSQHTVLD